MESIDAGSWVAPPPPGTGRTRRSLLTAAVLALGLPWAIGVSFVALKLWAAAASDCEVFEAGDRFAVLFLYWPVFTLGLWVVFGIAVLLLAKRSLVLGVAFGVVLTVAIAYLFVAGTNEMILNGGGADFCPTGLPDWWPDWAPR